MRTSRRHYLLTYDISDDKRRARVFKTLQDHGDHVQFSVFLCDLNPSELATLRGLLTPHIHARADQLIILDLGPAENTLDRNLQCMGRAYCPPNRVMVV